MITYQTRDLLRLRAKPGINGDTLGQIAPGGICYLVGGIVDADDLTWANIVAPVESGEWLTGWSALQYEGSDLLSSYTPPIRDAVVAQGSFPLSQLFAENPATYSALGYIGHNGLDFATPVGVPIVAMDSGVVSHATNDPAGYGNFVRINHRWGISLYAHLRNIGVGVGEGVVRGATIGFSGNTGMSTGPHLHFEVRVYPVDDNNGYGGRVDPLPMLDKKSYTFRSYVPERLREAKNR